MTNVDPVAERYSTALNKLARWRPWFAGWQLGTRVNADPESQAVRDHRETTMILRAEQSALARLLIEKGVCTTAEFMAAVADEAEMLDKSYEARWPGVRTTEDGLVLDVAVIREHGTMAGWKP